MVAWIENTLNLSDESPSYPMVPTSLLNPDIVLPTRQYRVQHSLTELPPSCVPEPREYNLDGTQGLLDLSWTQWALQIQLDDIDRGLVYSQYPYQEGDEYKEDEEDMELKEQVLGMLVVPVAAPMSTRCPYHRPEATNSYSMAGQTPGSPRIMHTDTDAAMEMGGLSVTSRHDSQKVSTWMEAPCKHTRMLSAPDLVTSITKGMTAVATEILEKFTHPPPVDKATNAAIWAHFQQWRAAAPQPMLVGTETSGLQSTFDWLGQQVQSPRKDDQWAPRPEMMPWKVDRGCQQCQEEEPQCSTSQKRCSQSWPRDKVDSKKGHTEGDGRSNKGQVGIDWANTGIQKPVPKPDSCHPSFKSDPSGAGNDPPPRVKSAVVPKGSQRQGSSHSTTTGSQGQSSEQSGRTSSPAKLGDPEKRELKEKSYDWIAARVHCLDPKGYVEEINSFWCFGENAKSFALEIIAIIDWGWNYVDPRFCYPMPIFPHYLFNKFAWSRQGGGQVPNKPDHLSKARGDV